MIKIQPYYYILNYNRPHPMTPWSESVDLDVIWTSVYKMKVIQSVFEELEDKDNIRKIIINFDELGVTIEQIIISL